MISRLLAVTLLAFALSPLAAAAAAPAQDSGRAQDTPKARAGPRPADLVLLNGKILLFHGVERKAVVAGKGAAPKGAATSKSNAALDDAAQSDGAERPEFAEAAAIAGGRIAFVGTAADAKAYIGPKTQTIDLEGRMVMPGIIDGHFHGTRSTDCEMGYAGGTVAQILAKLQACLDRPDQAALKKSNVRLSASHFFGEEVEPPGTALTRYDLDRLETTRPIFVENADGHKFWMNSRAIDNAHIDEHTPVPSGAQIGRDASGKPNGFFSDYEPADWGQTVPVTEESKLDVVRRTIADANRMGITSVFVPGGGEEEIAQWAKIQDDGKLTLRVNLGLSAGFVRGDDDVADLRRKIAALDAYKKYARGLIAVTSVKVYCDGVMESPAFTAAMLKPYRVNAGTPEKPDWRPGATRGPDPSCSDARTGFVELDKTGWQIHVHAIGDRATRDALDNFQAAREANGARDLRHTITHLQAIDEADVPRFGKLGVIASMSLQWARRDGYSVNYTAGYIDDALYNRFYPAAELWHTGAVIAGGSDYPVDPLLPMVQLETAIDHTGEAVPGVLPGALSPAERIPDLLAVIKMHTINGAYQMHQEKNTGSIEVGKQADLIVLSQNLFAIPTEQISDTKVLLTIMGGAIAYRDPDTHLRVGAGLPIAAGLR